MDTKKSNESLRHFCIDITNILSVFRSPNRDFPSRIYPKLKKRTKFEGRHSLFPLFHFCQKFKYLNNLKKIWVRKCFANKKVNPPYDFIFICFSNNFYHQETFRKVINNYL